MKVYYHKLASNKKKRISKKTSNYFLEIPQFIYFLFYFYFFPSSPVEQKKLPNYADSDDEISDEDVSEFDEINEEMVPPTFFFRFYQKLNF